jgi:hypothetical protein
VFGYRPLLLAWLALFCWQSAHAMSLRELRTLEKTEKQGRIHADYYLVGVMEGLLEAHQRAVRSGAVATICLGDRRLEPRMARGLLDGELRRNKDVYEADMPVGLVMRNALETVYPCEG